MGLSHTMTLAQAGIDLSQHPGLSPDLSFADLLKYGQIGLEVFQSLAAIRGAAVGSEGVTPPIKTDVGDACYTVVLDWSRTR